MRIPSNTCGTNLEDTHMAEDSTLRPSAGDFEQVELASARSPCIARSAVGRLIPSKRRPPPEFRHRGFRVGERPMLLSMLHILNQEAARHEHKSRGRHDSPAVTKSQGGVGVGPSSERDTIPYRVLPSRPASNDDPPLDLPFMPHSWEDLILVGREVLSGLRAASLGDSANV